MAELGWSLPDLVQAANVIVILACGFILGHLVELAAVKVSEHVGLRRHMRFGLERQLGRVGINADVMGLLGKAMKYTVYLVAVFFAVETLHIAAAAEMLKTILFFAPNIVAAFAFVILGSIVTEFATDIVKFSLKSNGLDTLLEEGGIKFKLSSVAAAFVRYLLYSAIAVIALAQLGFQILGLTLLVAIVWLAFILLLVVFAMFGLKEMLPNIFAGVYLRSSGHLAKGDRVSLGEVKGAIRRIGFISTEVESGKELAYIPNISLVKERYFVSPTQRKGPGTS